MTTDFPSLSSFGTLMKFALVLEQVAGELASAAANHPECASQKEALVGNVKKHEKRHRQLEQMRRERLNEVVLQPIQGMDRDKYLPPAAPTQGSSDELIAASIGAERASALFYDDAAVVASNVLSGLDKTFKRLARENRDLAQALQPPP